MKLLRIFEYGGAKTSEKTYWTIPVMENASAAEVCELIARKTDRGPHAFCLFEISLDGAKERRIDEKERPLDVVAAPTFLGLFCVKLNTVLRIYDGDANDGCVKIVLL
jgi:hypothetical protein